MRYTPADATMLFYDAQFPELQERQTIGVAELSDWGLVCTEGHQVPRFLSGKWSRHRYRCDTEHFNPTHEPELRVLSDAIAYLDDRQRVLASEWFHDTEISDPLQTTYDGWTHVGTAEAAQDRHSYHAAFHRPSTIRRVTLSPSARIHQNVLMEPARGPHGHHEFDAWFKEADVIRYINAHEAPGSVSLAVNPKVLLLA